VLRGTACPASRGCPILDASCSPTQMVSWLQVQVRAFAPLIRYTVTDISGRDQEDPSMQI